MLFKTKAISTYLDSCSNHFHAIKGIFSKWALNVLTTYRCGKPKKQGLCILMSSKSKPTQDLKADPGTLIRIHLKN